MKRLRMIVPAVLLVLAGCAGRNLLSDPEFGAQLSNQTDNFAFQASNLDDVTETVQWTWQNTGTNATVNHSSAITGGSATLTILDSTGQQLYNQPLAPSGTDGLGSGTPGSWIIRLTLTDVSGTINFEVQMAP